MKVITSLLTLFILVSFSVYSQTDCMSNYPKKVRIRKQTKLPRIVEETSGIIIFKEDFITHNDSGGEAILYRLDTETGELKGKITITNAKNKDWEDITQDDLFIYVGDFGNNSGKRKNLKIYKIPKKEIKEGDCEVEAEIIRFSYAEQTNFERRSHKHNFDCEAITSFGDSLLIFTKNWENHKTRMYVLPKQAGSYKISARQKCDVNGLITGVSYNSSLKTIALIGYEDYRPFMIVNRDFTGKFDKNSRRIRIKKRRYTQTEGIFLDDKGTIFISSERTKAFPEKIYQIKLDSVSCKK